MPHNSLTGIVRSKVTTVENDISNLKKLTTGGGIVTRRAALGDIGNRVTNRASISSLALGLKKDADTKKPSAVVTKAEPRRPLRSNSLILNAAVNKPKRSNSIAVNTESSKPQPSAPAVYKPIVGSRPVKESVTTAATKVQPLAAATRRPLSSGLRNVTKAEVHTRQPSTTAANKPPVVRSVASALGLKVSTSVAGYDKKGVSKTTATVVASKEAKTVSRTENKENNSLIELEVVVSQKVESCRTLAVLKEEANNEAAPISDDKAPIKPPESYSALMIPDIDVDDKFCPQLVSEYVNDIYDYLRQLERQQFINPNFLSDNDISGRMRGILIDWLVQVHMRFHLLPETMYMTVMLIDRYLQEKRVSKDQLQLLGVSALFMASKYEEIYAPEVGDFVYMTDHTYTKQQLRSMERLILRALRFDLGRPSAIHFLRRYSKACEADDYVHTMSKYFLETAFLEYSLAHVLPSLLAASAIWLSQKLLGDGKWTPTLIHYTTYEETEVLPVVKSLCQLLVNIYDKGLKLQAVRSKFSSKKFMEISQHESLSSPIIRQMAAYKS